MKPLFALTARIAPVAMTQLAEVGDVAVLGELPPLEADEILGRAHALIARTETVSQAMLTRGANLRVVVRHGVGYDNIDVAAATRLGLPVAYLPGINSDAVAEHVFGFVMHYAKQIPHWLERMAHRDWASRLSRPNIGLAGKTLGIVGFGNIGRMVARRGVAFDMRVLASDPYANVEASRSLGVELTDLDRLLSESDFVTLHTPGGEQTAHLIDAAHLAKMRPTAVLINTARGTLIDLDALNAALKAKQLAAAMLDVFPVEPPDFGHAIFTNPQVLATPHVASATRETTDKQGLAAATAAIDGVRGVRPSALANPDVWPGRAAVGATGY